MATKKMSKAPMAKVSDKQSLSDFNAAGMPLRIAMAAGKVAAISNVRATKQKKMKNG